jgi:prepilin-type N-terminal cleavage/methylation domain-containing protein
MRKAFTLIEVMVAVMIISVVIMALLQMRGNSSHIFSNLTQKLEINRYISFLISNSDYGFEKKTTTLDKLLGDFDVENDLRRELKSIKVEVIYQGLESIDIGSTAVLKIGKTSLKTDKSSASLLRLKLQ